MPDGHFTEVKEERTGEVLQELSLNYKRVRVDDGRALASRVRRMPIIINLRPEYDPLDFLHHLNPSTPSNSTPSTLQMQR